MFCYGRKSEEAAVEEVAFEHKFHFGVGMAIDLLDDEDFKHHNGIVGLSPDFGRMEGVKDLFERLPVDEFINAREDIFRQILIEEVFSYSELSAIF